MKDIYSVAQIRYADDYTINTLKVPEEILVARAGDAVAEEICKLFNFAKVLVCVGKGNNGNDGKVVAEILSIKNFIVKILDCVNPDFSLFDEDYDVIVDCIFGTGLNKIVTGEYKKIINKINQKNATIFACDIPSGLNGDNGKIMGEAIKANYTIAIQNLKYGYFLNDGLDYCGEIIVKDIGIVNTFDYNKVKLLENTDVSPLFHVRYKNVNKGCFGKASVVGGSKNYPGSVNISHLALSALKMGAGYTNIGIPNSIYNACATLNPECIVTVFNDNGNSIIYDEKALNSLLKYDAIAFGMGATVSQDIFDCIKYLLQNYKGNLLLDADALNCLSLYGVDALLNKNKKCKVVLTPHIGEFARLINTDKNEVICNPIEHAKNFAKKYGVTLVLKSASTIITDGEYVYVNITGNSALAKGGSGDMLSGIIAGLLARCDNVTLSCACGSYIMGRAAEIAVKDANEYTVTATDVIKALPQAINSLIM